LVNIALLSKDIEYNFPHRVSVTDIREKILQDIEDEQKRLEREKTASSDAKSQSSEDNKSKEMNYENYFGIVSKCNCLFFFYNFTFFF